MAQNELLTLLRETAKVNGDRKELFQAAYKKCRKLLKDGADFQTALNSYEIFVSELVNNPKSQFYIHG
jgi:hypothetical protein